MNIHLRSAATRYSIAGDFKIHPISEIDAEIIYELISVAGKLGEDGIKTVLQDWKFLKDKEILDRLIQWNLDNHEEIESVNSETDILESANNPIYFSFEGCVFSPKSIISISVSQNYDYHASEYKYYIEINKGVPENFGLHDLVFTFDDEEIRDLRLEELKFALLEYIDLKIV